LMRLRTMALRRVEEQGELSMKDAPDPCGCGQAIVMPDRQVAYAALPLPSRRTLRRTARQPPS
jgi:hypothetical protein